MRRLLLRGSTVLPIALMHACATDDLPVSPQSRIPTALVASNHVQPPVRVDSGCASVVVSIDGSGNAEARQQATAGCGDVAFDVDRHVARSAGGDTIAVSVNLRNSGSTTWRAPLWLFIDEDSVSTSHTRSGVQTRPPHLVGSDTMMTIQSGAQGLRHGWQLRRAVPDSIIMRVYPGGATIRDTIRIVVDRAETRLTLPVRAYVALTDPVTPMAPRGVPDEVRRELVSSRIVVTNSERLTGAFARNYLLLYFDEDTDTERKQATIDLFGGDVVGGYPMTPGGWYLVRLPETTSEDAMFEAMAAMQQLPHIRWVTPMLMGETRMHLRPNDGANWTRTSWRLDQTRTSGHTWAMERIGAAPRSGSRESVRSGW